MNKKKRIVGIILAVVVLLIGGIFAYYYGTGKEVPLLNITLNKHTYEKERIPDHGYRSETTYDGTGDFDEAVYDIAFNLNRYGVQTEGEIEYISNIELVKKYGLDNIKKLDDFTKSYMETLLNAKYRAVEDDKAGFVNSIADGTMLMIDPDAFTATFHYLKDIEEYAQAIIDNKIQCDAVFKTDTSLVYQDFMVTVRGELDIEAYGTEDSDMSLFRIPLNKSGRYIVDVIVNMYTPSAIVIDVVGEITDEGLVEYEPITWDERDSLRNY